MGVFVLNTGFIQPNLRPFACCAHLSAQSRFSPQADW
jgi:hypothetical protein